MSGQKVEHYAAAGVPARALPLRARADAQRAGSPQKALEGASVASFSGGVALSRGYAEGHRAFCSALIRAMN